MLSKQSLLHNPNGLESLILTRKGKSYYLNITNRATHLLMETTQEYVTSGMALTWTAVCLILENLVLITKEDKFFEVIMIEKFNLIANI